MKTTIVVVALVLPALALGTYFAYPQASRAEPGFHTGIFDPPHEAPPFSLDGSNGKKLSLSDHLVRAVILEFGFTYCQAVCPVTLARLKEVHKRLGSAASNVQLIFVTVDPQRDNPERLREYLTEFNPTFLGATGPPSELEAVHKAYGVVAEKVVSKNKALGYEVEHSSSLYLIDQQGKLRGLVPYGRSADDIVHDLELLLNRQT